MTVIRVNKNDNYFCASNEPFNNAELSFGARGILGYLLSKPDGWTVRNQDLYNQSPAGPAAIKRMLAELKEHGYLRRFRTNNENGHLEWITEVYEDRTLNPDYQPPKVENRPIGETTEGRKTDGRLIDRIVSTESVSTDKDSLPKGNAAKRRPPTKKPKDDRTKHPAIQAFRSAMHRYPAKNTYDNIIATVGDRPPDVEFWRQVVDKWKLCPYQPTNYAGMLDCFTKHELPNPQKGLTNGRKKSTAPEPRQYTPEQWQAMLNNV